MVERLRILVLMTLVAVLAGGAWMLARERLKRWARETEGQPWFAVMPIGFGLMPVTWQGWLVALAILLVTFALGMLGAAGVFGPGNHPHHY